MQIASKNGSFNNELKLKANERLDDLQYSGLKIIQNKKLYCFSSDAVLLCNFVKAKKSDIIVDLCSGSGVVGILAQAKTDAKNLIMIEKQPELAEMCERSLQFNKLKEKAKVFCCDIIDAPSVLSKQLNLKNVDVVCINPPYYLPNQKKMSGNEKIDMAKFEIALNLKTICEISSKILKFGGRFFMVNDSDRIAEILSTLTLYNLQPKVVQFVFPKEDEKSNVVLIEAIKGGKQGSKVLYKKV